MRIRGSWLDDPNSLRFAFRLGYPIDLRTKNIGFRVVRELSGGQTIIKQRSVYELNVKGEGKKLSIFLI